MLTFTALLASPLIKVWYIPSSTKFPTVYTLDQLLTFYTFIQLYSWLKIWTCTFLKWDTYSWRFYGVPLVPERKLIKTTGGFENYYFIPTVPITNYRDLFYSIYPDTLLDAKMKFILDSFSESHARVMEQSVITFVKPPINAYGIPVSFTFPAIDIATYAPSAMNDAHPITVYTTDGAEYNHYSSIRNRLGITDSTLITARNRPNFLLHCPTPGLDLFFRPGAFFRNEGSLASGPKTRSRFRLGPRSGTSPYEI